MKNKTKRIAVLTSGGDSPGMNAAVRAVVKAAAAAGMESFLVRDGYRGLVANDIIPADPKIADQMMSRGGTYIYSARLPEFKEEKVRKQAVANLEKSGIHSLVVIGGDGSYMGAKKLTEMGINCIGLPGTIDNDIVSSERTIGFDTAFNTVVDTVDKLRDTSESHSRCCIIEIMGRNCPDLTVFGAIATGADLAITNENYLKPEEVLKAVKQIKSRGKRSVIVMVSELVYGTAGRPTLAELATMLTEKLKIDVRVNVIGHTQRGGKPSANERLMATLMGAHAVNLVAKNIGGRVVGNKGFEIIDYDIMEALEFPRESRQKFIQLSNKLGEQ